MRKIIFLLVGALLLGGCDEPLSFPQPPQTATIDQNYLYSTVHKFFDKEAGVVCWVYRDNGISCLPVSQTKLGEKK